MSGDAHVRLGARLLYGTDVLFKDLAVGERFTFPRTGQVMVKSSLKGGYRYDGTKKPTYETGRRTAVVRAA